MPRFRDRREAGRRLGERLRADAQPGDAVVLALPRGGVPVGREVATALAAPFDVFVVRKLGVPGREELALGALASGGVLVLNDAVVDAARLSEAEIAEIGRREREELERRERLYRGERAPIDVAGRSVYLVDDGLATGATMRAAARAVRSLGPRRVVVAVPVGARSTCDELAREVDAVVCLATPEPFGAVGLWYDDFSQTGDDEVRAALAAEQPHEREVTIPVEDGEVSADLSLPSRARAVVVFAHGTGSSRRSGRNRRVAAALREDGLATLLVDLLTPAEERADAASGRYRFDVSLLARRVTGTLDWLGAQEGLRGLPIGLFGASTGAAAALLAAAERPDAVRAVVSRGGRPDLAGEALRTVLAPTLLLVGERDPEVLRLNREAMARMTAETRLDVVAGATHLFEEPGALDEVARLAAAWFRERLRPV